MIMDKAQAWQASRMGQVDNNTYKQQMYLLEWELKLLDKPGAMAALEGK